ncbi:acyltransferase family protein [Cognaticolwellia mytili]|uniref:acyltransferase family protein n=1 Tax=Cognaticolwellia mytili TaxID=1888913 RepID=UPI001301FD34|nr:acyltransferase family protein [Cognaticolwellia mytili]
MTTIAKLFIPNQKHMPERRYDLDWLRVIAFGLLILFHCGMFYVENWGWHVKSQHSSQFLENIMLIVEPWRMALLWLIAGIAIRFIIAKVSVWRFISMRSLRILLPLLFGILIVVPPQLYVEMTNNGDLNMNYWQFLKVFFSDGNGVFDKYQSGIWPHIDVNHLWFLRSLWQYSLVILCLLPLLNSTKIENCINWLFKQYGVIAILLTTLPIFIIQINWSMEQVRYPLGFTFMVYGYLIGWQTDFWQRISNNISWLICSFAIAYISFIFFYNQVWLVELSAPGSRESWLLMLGMFIYSLLRILGVLALFAIAHKMLNKKSKQLSYLNEAVYPFYILHQSFIVVIGYNISRLSLSATIEAISLISATIICCFISFEIIKRINILRPFFGIPMQANDSLINQRFTYAVAVILVLPIGFEIIL